MARRPASGGGTPQQIGGILAASVPAPVDADFATGAGNKVFAVLLPVVALDDTSLVQTLTLQLYRSTSQPDVTIHGVIWANDAGAPGAVVATSPAVPYNRVPTTLTPFTFGIAATLPAGEYLVGFAKSGTGDSTNIGGGGTSAPAAADSLAPAVTGPWSDEVSTERVWYQLRGRTTPA